MLPALLAALGLALAPAAMQESPRTPTARLEVAHAFEPYGETLLAADRLGVALAWQPDEQKEDGGRVWRAEPGLPGARQISLSPGLIARTVGAAPGDGPGRLEGLASDGGDVLFLWRGRVEGRTDVVLGRYVPLGHVVELQADTRTIADAAEIEGSLVLAETQLLRSDDQLWVLVRDLDRAVLLRRPLAGYGLGGRVNIRPLPREEADASVPAQLLDQPPPDLRSSAVTIAPGLDGGLTITDRDRRIAWTLSQEGLLKPIAHLDRLPLSYTPPVGSDPGPAAPEGLYLLTADTARTGGGAELLRGAAPAFPALVRIEAGEAVPLLGRDHLQAPRGLPVHILQPQRLVPAGPGSWVTYDRTTGLLLRLHLALPERQ